MIRHPPANNQRAVALFLSLGYHDALVRRLSHAYRARWLAMGEALGRTCLMHQKHLYSVGHRTWVRGPTPLDVRILQRTAAVKSILIKRGLAARCAHLKITLKRLSSTAGLFLTLKTEILKPCWLQRLRLSTWQCPTFA